MSRESGKANKFTQQINCFKVRRQLFNKNIAGPNHNNITTIEHTGISCTNRKEKAEASVNNSTETGAVAFFSNKANDKTMLMLARLANTVSVFSDAARQHMKAIDLHIAISQDRAGSSAVEQKKELQYKIAMNVN